MLRAAPREGLPAPGAANSTTLVRRRRLQSRRTLTLLSEARQRTARVKQRRDLASCKGLPRIVGGRGRQRRLRSVSTPARCGAPGCGLRAAQGPAIRRSPPALTRIFSTPAAAAQHGATTA